jgi:uncharacterized protein (DUF2141 family)
MVVQELLGNLLGLQMYLIRYAVFVLAGILLTGHQDLTLHFEGMSSNKGKIYVSLFHASEGFPQDETKAVFKGVLEVTGSQHSLPVKNLTPGDYSVAAFHDENGNQLLDKHFLGYPTEAFGFSQNPKVVFGAPSFKETKFHLSNDSSHITVKIKRWGQ